MSATNETVTVATKTSKAPREIPTTYGKLNAAEKKLFCYNVHALKILKEKGLLSSDFDEFNIDIELIYAFNEDKNIFKELDLEVKAYVKEQKKEDAIRLKMDKLMEKEAEKEAKKLAKLEAKKDAKKEKDVKTNTKKETKPEVGPKGTLRSSEYEAEEVNDVKEVAVKPKRAPKKKETTVVEPEPVIASEYKATVRVKMYVEFNNTDFPEDKLIDLLHTELQIDPYNTENDIYELEIVNLTDCIYEVVYKVKNLEEKEAVFEAEFMTDINSDGNSREIAHSYRMGDVKYEPIVTNTTDVLIKAGMRKPRVTRKKQIPLVETVVDERVVEPVVEVVEQVVEPEQEPVLKVTEELAEEPMIEEPPKKEDKVADIIMEAFQEDDVPPKNVTMRKKYVRKPKVTAEK